MVRFSTNFFVKIREKNKKGKERKKKLWSFGISVRVDALLLPPLPSFFPHPLVCSADKWVYRAPSHY